MLNKEELKQFNHLSDYFKLDFIHSPVALNVNTVDGLPLNKWVIIDKSHIGINYALKTLHTIYVYTGRIFGADFMQYSYTDFNNWRMDISKLGGA